jgi:hypothetical protein
MAEALACAPVEERNSKKGLGTGFSSQSFSFRSQSHQPFRIHQRGYRYRHARWYGVETSSFSALATSSGAFSGQKLPIVDGFVATGDRPLDRYERAFYQFSVDVLPGSAGGIVVRLTAKITAWYADREPWKSGYQVLLSNGRLELDFLDRLSEKLGEKPVASVLKSQVQAPAPKLDLSTGLPKSSLPPPKISGETSAIPAPAIGAADPTSDELATLRVKREAAEKRMSELAAELRTLQGHPAQPGAPTESGDCSKKRHAYSGAAG